MENSDQHTFSFFLFIDLFWLVCLVHSVFFFIVKLTYGEILLAKIEPYWSMLFCGFINLLYNSDAVWVRFALNKGILVSQKTISVVKLVVIPTGWDITIVSVLISSFDLLMHRNCTITVDGNFRILIFYGNIIWKTI